MKTERFLVSLFMLNIILCIILIFSLKNDTLLTVFEEIFYSKKVDSAFMSFSPDLLNANGFVTDPEDVFKAGMDEIFNKTDIKRADLSHINILPPLERAEMIVKMIGGMGDGVCEDNLSIADKIIAVKQKKGCQRDFAMIFSALAKYSGLKTRMVKNSVVYGVEIFNGTKWIFIDPYFALAAYNSENSPLSFYQLNHMIQRNEKVRLDFFGGQNHCMYGKDAQKLPYYSNSDFFGSVYALMGDNIFSIAQKEATTPENPKFVHTFAPYRSVKPHWILTFTGPDIAIELKKTVTGGIVVWVILLIASDIIFPIYFIRSRFSGRKG